ncbi:MAG: hypothetical protein WCJ30_12110 [Deltaproteobacteria bacterium]
MTTSLALSDRPRTALDVYKAPSHTLFSIMADGVAPPFDDLVGSEFNGLNIGLGAGLLGIRKFRKGFYRGAPRGDGPEPFIQGYNIPAKQNGAGNVHIAKPSDAQPKRFGFYRCFEAAKDTRFNRWPRAMLLNYGMGGNGFRVEALLRDYLVQVVPGDSDVLLGYAVFALGPLKIPGGFFVLDRWGKHTFTG